MKFFFFLLMFISIFQIAECKEWDKENFKEQFIQFLDERLILANHNIQYGSDADELYYYFLGMKDNILDVKNEVLFLLE